MGNVKFGILLISTVLLSSCGMLNGVYDDVYHEADIAAEQNNGYQDLIKSNEKHYEMVVDDYQETNRIDNIEPCPCSGIFYRGNNPYNYAWGFNSGYPSSWYYSSFYGNYNSFNHYSDCYGMGFFNSHPTWEMYMPWFPYAYGNVDYWNMQNQMYYSSYYGYYNYGYNPYSYDNGYTYWYNYGNYYGNPYYSNGWNQNGNSVNQNTTNGGSGKVIYGHRGNISPSSSNTTSYLHTVKSTSSENENTQSVFVSNEVDVIEPVNSTTNSGNYSGTKPPVSNSTAANSSHVQAINPYSETSVSTIQVSNSNSTTTNQTNNPLPVQRGITDKYQLVTYNNSTSVSTRTNTTSRSDGQTNSQTSSTQRNTNSSTTTNSHSGHRTSSTGSTTTTSSGSRSSSTSRR